MMRHILIYKQLDIVKVPFPFTDRGQQKMRPALIISSDEHFNEGTGRYVLAMVTSSKHTRWPLDYEIKDLEYAGLTHSSIVRMKLFTLDKIIIQGKLGSLSGHDTVPFLQNLHKLVAQS